MSLCRLKYFDGFYSHLEKNSNSLLFTRFWTLVCFIIILMRFYIVKSTISTSPFH